MVIQPIRFNWHYVIWYRNVTLLIFSLVVPFVLLAYWNFNIVAVMLRRRRLRNRPRLSYGENLPLQRHGSENSEFPNRGIALEELNFGVSVRNLRPNYTPQQGMYLLCYQ